MCIWRIASDTPKYVADDLTGRGAEITGGRWNRKGTAMLYASSSRALACLETLVHMSGGVPLPLNRYLVELTIPDEIWAARTVFEPSAHVGWDAEPAGRVSIEWGENWVLKNATLLADVPSIVVPQESNILTNPAHPDLKKVAVRKVQRWTYDARLR